MNVKRKAFNSLKNPINHIPQNISDRLLKSKICAQFGNEKNIKIYIPNIQTAEKDIATLFPVISGFLIKKFPEVFEFNENSKCEFSDFPYYVISNFDANRVEMIYIPFYNNDNYEFLLHIFEGYSKPNIKIIYYSDHTISFSVSTGYGVYSYNYKEAFYLKTIGKESKKDIIDEYAEAYNDFYMKEFKDIIEYYDNMKLDWHQASFSFIDDEAENTCLEKTVAPLWESCHSYCIETSKMLISENNEGIILYKLLDFIHDAMDLMFCNNFLRLKKLFMYLLSRFKFDLKYIPEKPFIYSDDFVSLFSSYMNVYLYKLFNFGDEIDLKNVHNTKIDKLSEKIHIVPKDGIHVTFKYDTIEDDDYENIRNENIKIFDQVLKDNELYFTNLKDFADNRICLPDIFTNNKEEIKKWAWKLYSPEHFNIKAFTDHLQYI